MFKSMIARLVAYATKTGKPAQDKIGRNFIKVWTQDGHWFIRVTAVPGDRLEPAVIQGIRNECEWTDLQQDPMSDRGVVFTGTPPEAGAPSPKPTRRINEDELKALHAIRAKHGFEHEDVKTLILNLWSLKSTTLLNRAQFQELVDTILPAGRATVAARGFYKRGA